MFEMKVRLKDGTVGVVNLKLKKGDMAKVHVTRENGAVEEVIGIIEEVLVED